MSTQTPIETTPQGIVNRRTIRVQWGGTTPVATGDVCVPDMLVGGAAVKSVQIEGTFNGATVAIQGSNDGVTFETLLDPANNAISKNAAGLFQIATPALWIQPVVTGGGASTALLITVFAARQF